MTLKRFNACPLPYIPKFTSSIDWSSCAVLPSKLKQCTADFLSMSLKTMDRFTNSGVPYDGSFIKRPCQNHISIWIEMQWNKFSLMTFKGWVYFTHLYIPKFSCTIHWSCSHENSMRIKWYGNDFSCMSIKCR